MKLCLLVAIVVVAARAQLLNHHDSCRNRCFLKNDYSHSCQCDSDCETIGNCCGDFWTSCRGSETGLVVTSKELNTFAQSIWDNDVNRIDSALYTLNYQGVTTAQDTEDLAPAKLINPVDGQLDAILADQNTTYPSFIQLLDNYAVNVKHVEHRTSHEIQEENRFWNAISQTQVMQLTFQFLVNNGFMKSDMHAFRTVINELWFELYPKQHETLRSDSGFEHIMIGEKTVHARLNNTGILSGFNNWVQFYQEENAGDLDYQGYIKYSQDPNAVDVRFLWKSAMSRASPFFVGTSPEFDMAIYTVCALARPNKSCSFTINGQNMGVQTTVGRHQQILQLTSAHPMIRNPNTATTVAA